MLVYMVQDSIDTMHRTKLGNPVTHSQGWEPPDKGWLKLNCDGVVSQEDGSVGAGGLLRDEKGQFWGGFMSNLRICSPLALNDGSGITKFDSVPHCISILLDNEKSFIID
ncbi:hypothetical protein Sjap_017131 [Stephania japonica]|uniref:RNase H type-1 domain-containing protein n=1 Tax=Stephania japonica TaxID=461633 RepID=A0AAP0I5K7_9MAGN